MSSYSKTKRSMFGRQLLPLWKMDLNFTNLNFGSFGSVPISITNTQREWISQAEVSPDKWFRYDAYLQVDQNRQSLANYLNVDPSDLAFVRNASAGVNAVLRSLQPTLKQGSKILILDLAYGMVKTVLQYLQDTYNCQVIQINISFPTSNDKIINAISTALEAHPEVAFVSVSHISSVPALILPVKDIVQICHQRNALVMIDGAHAMGQIPVDIQDINPDFYVSNGHKWMYTPKGSAILWVKKEQQQYIVPSIISGGGSGKTPFQLWFSYEGTGDYSPYLCFQKALEFRSVFGDKEIMDYIHQLAIDGGNELVSIWKTEKLVSDDMIGAMVNVRVPSQDAALMAALPKLLLDQYNTYVPVYLLQGAWYVRVSAQIFNELSDFTMLGLTISSIINTSSSSSQKQASI